MKKELDTQDKILAWKNEGEWGGPDYETAEYLAECVRLRQAFDDAASGECLECAHLATTLRDAMKGDK